MAAVDMLKGQPNWGGQPETFSAWEKALPRFAVIHKVAGILEHHKTLTKLTPPSERAALIDANATLFVILLGSLSETLQATAIPDAILSSFEPQQLYDAILKHAKGAIPALSGPAPHEQLYNTYEHAHGGSNHENLTASVTELKGILNQSVTLNDTDYKLTEAQIVFVLISNPPSELAAASTHITDNCKTFQAALIQLGTIAKKLDKKVVSRALVSKHSKTKTPKSDHALYLELAAKYEQKGGGAAGGSRGGKSQAGTRYCKWHDVTTHNTEDCRDRPGSTAPAPASRGKRTGGPSTAATCDICNSPEHWARDCDKMSRSERQAYIALIAKYQQTPTPQTYGKAPDGSFYALTVFDISIMAQQALALPGSTDDLVFADTGADRSMFNNAMRFSELRLLTAAEQKRYNIVGVGNGKPPAGVGTVTYVSPTQDPKRPLVVQDRQVFFNPELPFSIQATSALAHASLSTIVDATRAGQLRIESSIPDASSGTNLRIEGLEHGNLFSIPITAYLSEPRQQNLSVMHIESAEFATMMQSTVPTTTIALPAHQHTPKTAVNEEPPTVLPPPPPPPLPLPLAEHRPIVHEDYAAFAAHIGGGHATVVKAYAKKLGITLTTTTNPAYETAAAIAAQRNNFRDPAKGMHDEPANRISGDTLGGKMPESARGNRYAITWTANFDPEVFDKKGPWVSCHSTHSASEALAGFSATIHAAGIPISSDPAINRTNNVRYLSDLGTEFKGEFEAWLLKHGIRKDHSTAWDKNNSVTGPVENANGRIQKGARLNDVLSYENFKAFNLDPAKYWDRNYEYAALQLRTKAKIGQLPPHMSKDKQKFERDAVTNVPMYGSVGTMTVFLDSTSNQGIPKQLKARARAVLCIGMEADGRYIVVDQNGAEYTTSKVRFMSTRDQVQQALQSNVAVPSFVPVLDAGHSTSSVADILARDGALDDSDDDAFPALTTPVDTHIPWQPEFALEDKVEALYGKEWFSGWISATGYSPGHARADDDVDVTFHIDGTFERYTRNDPNASLEDHVRHMPATTPSPPPTPVPSDSANAPCDEEDDSDDEDDLPPPPTIVAAWHDDDSDDDDELPPQPIIIAAWNNSHVHHSIKDLLNDLGDVKHEYLTGLVPLPPPPPLPQWTPSTAPPPPKNFQAMERCEDALLWLHALVDEVLDHPRRPTYTQTPMSEADASTTNHKGQWTGITTVWRFVYKFEGNVLTKFKARQTIAGHPGVLTPGIDFDPNNTYHGAASVDDLKLLTQLALHLDLITSESDIQRAYLAAYMPDTPTGKKVHVRQSRGTRMRTPQSCFIAGSQNMFHQEVNAAGISMTSADIQLTNDTGPRSMELICIVWRAWYGHPVSGNAHTRQLHKYLLGDIDHPTYGSCPIRLCQCTANPNIFTLDDTRYPKATYWLWVHNDNVRHYYDNVPLHATFLDWYGSVYPITGGDAALSTLPPQECLGMTITYDTDNDTVSFSMEPYSTKVLTKYGLADCNKPKSPMETGLTFSKADRPTTQLAQQIVIDAVTTMFPMLDITTYLDVITEAQSLLYSIQWFATQVGPSLKTAMSILGKHTQYPTVPWFQATKRLLRFMKDPDPIVCRKSASPLAITIETDSSFNSDIDSSKSQGGYIASTTDNPPFTSASFLSKTVKTSTYQAEKSFAAEACKTACYIEQLLNNLKVNHGKITLKIDNNAAFMDLACSLTKFTKQNKHFTVQEKFAEQCVDDGTVVPVKVPGADLTADAMTKILPAPAFRKCHNVLHYGTHSPP